jgi:hypothetical protein
MSKQKAIITKENYIIYQDQKNPFIYLLEFHYANRSLINSLVKSKLLKGSTITNNYKSLQFKATSVVTYNPEKQATLNESQKIIMSLVTQLEYLIKNESRCFLGYNKEDLIIINDNIYIYLGCDYLCDILQNTIYKKENLNKILLSMPFNQNDFFISPELHKVKELPSYIHFKTCYFSLGCLILSLLYPDLEKIEPNALEITEILEKSHFKNTRIYYFLSRIFIEEPEKRTLIYF